jgi:hypothetical protein
LVAAVACSAAAGKNPWLPLALIFLLAAPDSVPSLMMAPDLQRQLHALGPEPMLWTLGAVFLLLALADSLADKVSVIEKWLVPISTAWRPFAGVAVATIIGVAAANDAIVEPAAEQIEALRTAALSTAHADLGGFFVGGSIVVLTILAGALVTWIATVSKTGTRLLMQLVPVPGIRLAHSLIDDMFAVGASIAGLAFGHTELVLVLIILYVIVGLFTGPILTRLAWIHVRIGWSLLRKGYRRLDEVRPVHQRPRWLEEWLGEHRDATALPSYVYNAPDVGRCRAGYLVLMPGKVVFVTRVWFRPKTYTIDEANLARVGLADSTTARIVMLVERLETGALREVRVVLFPALESEVHAALGNGATRAGLVRVRSDSRSARRALPGFADAGRSPRFLPAEEAGSLRIQGLVTIVAAVAFGILTSGLFVPIGTGYLFSPFKRRFLLGLLISGYLSLCVFASMFLGWPAAVLYASLLNVLVLRDLTRNALKARVDGYVDRRAWVPAVASRVWVPTGQVSDNNDVHRDGDAEPLTDGTWRAVGRILAEPIAEPVAATS